MVWYTIKLDGKTYRIISKLKLQAFLKTHDGQNFTVIERRSRGDTTKPETYT